MSPRGPDRLRLLHYPSNPVLQALFAGRIMTAVRPTLGLTLLLALAGAVSAQDAPSYARHVKPFLAKYCLECHNSKEAKSGLNLETYKGLRDGSDAGAVVTPGKADDSTLVLLIEGKDTPKMPPKTARQPRAAEIARLRAWVAAGARDDSAEVKSVLPEIKPRVPAAPPVAAVAYRPDGKMLAAGGYQEALLLDASGALVGKLPGQTGAVTALAFSRDGKRLAVASGVSGVSGEVRLYRLDGPPADRAKPERVLAAHADLIHDLAFSPDGQTLATCGYDRLVHLWDVAGGQRLRTLKEHSDAVYGVAFSPDGTLLASAAADRAVKVCRVADGKLLYTLSEANDWVYAVAWSPDGKHLAAAGVDKSLRVWQAGADGAKLVQSVFAHEAAVTRLVYAADGQTLYSLGEDRTVKAWDPRTLAERRVHNRQPEAVLALAVRPDRKQLALGRYDGALLLVDAADGKVQAQPLPLKPQPAAKERFGVIREVEPNDSPGTGQWVALSATLVGALGKTGDVDFYRFTAKAGAEVGVQALTKEIGSKLEPFLQIIDVASGRVVAEGGDGVLGYTCPKAGVYALGVRDRDYRGGPGMTYKLNVGAVPVVTSVFPLGLQRGTTADVQLQGVHLGGLKSVRLAAAPDAAVGARLPLPLPQLRETPLGLRTLIVGEFPEVVGKAGGQLPTPGTGNGVLAEPGAAHVWRFSAKKGQRLIVEVNARRLGSPLDSAIDILDGKGQPIPRATLRSLARTHVTFRDHDSVTAGIRLDNWNELAMNDYLYVGGELLRIKALPLNPDADCNFFSAGGQRVGYLDTTPTHHANGTPMYKVAIHPPGTKFPPNGFPVVTLYYRNDDGGPGYGRDARLFFDPPADGDYQVRITDSRGQGGPAYAYRLTVRPPRPGFNVSVSPSKPAVWLGGAVPVTVNAERLDGFDGEIKVRLDKVPAGFAAPATAIGVDENSTTFALWADATAKATSPLQLVAEAVIDGQKVVKTVAVGPVTTKAAGDLVTVTLEDVVTLRPGGEAKMRVRIERRNGFTGRVPLDVRGLPHGVRVLDIGLNGILITERETTRTVVLYAEPWVAAQERPFVVLARREGKNTEHAAKSVLLKVVAGGP